MSNSDKPQQESVVAGLINSSMPADGTAEAYGLALAIRQFLMSIKDEGTGIDSGGWLGSADLWVTVHGVEYYINVERLRKK